MTDDQHDAQLPDALQERVEMTEDEIREERYNLPHYGFYLDEEQMKEAISLYSEIGTLAFDVADKTPLPEDPDEREELAYTSENPDALAALAEDKDEYIQSVVKINPHAPRALSDRWEKVRFARGLYPSAPAFVYSRLAKDEDEDVRYLVAANSNAPYRARMEAWSRSSNPTERAFAGSKESTTKGTLARLAKDTDEDVRASVAGNPKTPSKILIELSEDEDEGVREVVVNNPNAPREALSILAKDANKDVRRVAINSLQDPR